MQCNLLNVKQNGWYWFLSMICASEMKVLTFSLHTKKKKMAAVTVVRRYRHHQSQQGEDIVSAQNFTVQLSAKT